jgi:hypothetical protein
MEAKLMRIWLIEQYPSSASWARKVKEMSDAQVFAVYNRLKKKEQ